MMTALRFPPPPRHHPPAEFLIDYASGAVSPVEALMIETHLALCPDCCLAARYCDAIGGTLLAECAPARLPPNLLNRTLAAIDAGGAEFGGPADSDESAPLPALIRRHLGAESDVGPWRRLPGGFAARRLPLACRSGRIVLMKARAGGTMLRHRHVGDEWTLVLQGGFSDKNGQYDRGDFIFSPDGDEHRPIAAAKEGCVCMALIRADLQFTGLMGRLAAPFIKV
jgi:putative transcriptional regulator